MSLDFSSLGDLAKKEPGKPGWVPPTIADLAVGDVLAFDQSLTATGWLRLVITGDCAVIFASGKYGGGCEDLRGHEQDLSRGVEIFERTVQVMQTNSHPQTDYVHETPPIGGKVKGGGTSSLLAAQAVRIAAATMGHDVTMSQAQAAKKMICGDARADKAVAHAALTKHFGEVIEGYAEHITNEAKRDALLVALLHLVRKKAA